MKTKGISLIVLIITILVLSILATTVVVSLSNTDIIGRANSAVSESNLNAIKEEFNLKVISYMAENGGKITVDGEKGLYKQLQDEFGVRGYSVEKNNQTGGITISNSEVKVEISTEGVVEVSNSQDTAAKSYTMLFGAGQVFNKNNTGEQLVFRSAADHSTFKEVKIDGQVVGADNYTTASGSTVITFTSQYSQMLADGTHTVSIVSNNGAASCQFEVGRYTDFTIDSSNMEEVFGINQESTAFEIQATFEWRGVKYRVTEIDEYAFEYAMALKTITIPNTVTKLSPGAFCGLGEITEIALPNSITRISESAFGDCFSVKTISLPNSITHIDYAAFANCDALETIEFNGTQAQWNAIEKANGWNESMCNWFAAIIRCIDGDIELS